MKKIASCIVVLLTTSPVWSMGGFYGPYSFTREASGTAWQPESSPHRGLHLHSGGWMVMVHGQIDGIYDHQAGTRGGDKWFTESMFMTTAQHALGLGVLGLRNMISLDPTMGANGYPLLAQTGETADGQTPLIDRQHPHDFIMELAATYSVPFVEKGSAFLYLGLPGEPALGPPTFMHRFSGMENPEAPLSHHWMDATHITYGVTTAGWVWDNWKLEGSAFRGREPDQYRWDVEAPKLDSYAGRLSYNPTPNWSLQTSWGFLHSPEQLEPEVNLHRMTSSVMYNRPFSHANWQTTLVWGQNNISGQARSDAYLLESAITVQQRHTLFARAERVEKNELFLAGDPNFGKTFTIPQASLGCVEDFQVLSHGVVGVGGVVTMDFLPAGLEASYGAKNPLSAMLFLRLKLI